ncbi:hypothetical protein FRC03_002091 [Tulasnella sp. 419]|nr:hypothetical protein FRC03_002091 [Tulasnella sp. 419]
MSRPPRSVRRTPLGSLVKGKSSTDSTSSSTPPLMVPALTKTKLEHVKSPHELTSFVSPFLLVSTDPTPHNP